MPLFLQCSLHLVRTQFISSQSVRKGSFFFWFFLRSFFSSSLTLPPPAFSISYFFLFSCSKNRKKTITFIPSKESKPNQTKPNQTKACPTTTTTTATSRLRLTVNLSSLVVMMGRRAMVVEEDPWLMIPQRIQVVDHNRCLRRVDNHLRPGRPIRVVPCQNTMPSRKRF